MIYKLNEHLKSCSERFPEYENLYATWSLNRRTCSEALKSVLLNYPHFSMHDAGHSEAVIAKMEMLLGERVDKLSPTDTWLLLHAAYAHDLGMILTWDDVEKTWKSAEFREFLLSLLNSEEYELRRAAEYVRSNGLPGDGQIWPLQLYRSVTLINATYFRSKHAAISRAYMEQLGASLQVDFGHNHMVQPRLLKLLGRICELHTMPTDSVLELPYQTDGFGADYAHPRFIAMLLRLGDLLDVDNGRFNPSAGLVSGGLPESSVPHREKHEATNHLLVTPKEIQFGSDCPNQKAYLETRNFVTWLEEEIDFLTKYWTEIVPDNIGGYPPRLRQVQLLINGVPDVQGMADLHFEISQPKAFQIIEGSNIYEDKFVFIREVIQNAMDASKIQLWRDLTSGTYAAWISAKDVSRLQPYELNKKIYESYSIKIYLTALSSGELKIEVTDRGTGISADAFKRMCNVGTSNAGSKQMTEEIRSMPNWLRPTAGFGVGLQSIFLMADRFEVDTSTGTEAFHAVFYSHRAGGHLQLQPVKERRARGTTIRVVFRIPERYKYTYGGRTDSYFSEHYDPMSSENHTGEMRILDAIETNCGETIFPIQIECSETSMPLTTIRQSLPVCGDDTSGWEQWGGHYHIMFSEEDCCIRIWDDDEAAYSEIRTSPETRFWSNIRFKGMEIDDPKQFIISPGLISYVDIYGLETRENITLDRESFTEKGFERASQIVDDLFDVSKEYFIKRMTGLSEEEQERVYRNRYFIPFSFWFACKPEQKERIPAKLIGSILQEAYVLSKNEDGKWKKTKKPVNRIIPFNDSTWFVNLRRFNTRMPPDTMDYDTILSRLNSIETGEMCEIIADDELIHAASQYYTRRVMLPPDCIPVALYTISTDPVKFSPMMIFPGEGRETILRGLGGCEDDGYQRRKTRPGKRWVIPTLEEYGELAIGSTPHGATVAYGELNLGRHAWILSPFDRELAEKAAQMDKEAFTELVLSSDTFPNVVKYVRENGMGAKDLNEERIIELYRKLIGEYYDAMKRRQEKSDLE